MITRSSSITSMSHNRFISITARMGAAIFALLVWTFFFGYSHAASDFPSRSVTIVVPYPPGGPNDLVARPLAAALQDVLNTSVIVDNRPGATGNIGTSHVGRAKPDGYTLLLPGPPFAIAPAILASVPYKVDDFRSISLLAEGPNLLVAHESLGVNTLDDLIALAKERPGALSYASGGVGTSLHLGAEMFKTMADVDITHIPYKGTSEFMPDVITGRTPIAFMNPQVARQHVEAGTLRALGSTGKKPLLGWEHIPTIDSMLPGYSVTTWFALLAPADTPDDVIATLNEAVEKAQTSETVLNSLKEQGMVALTSSPDEADSFIRTQADTWSDWVETSGIERIQ